jgi:hypothetical protein
VLWPADFALGSPSLLAEDARLLAFTASGKQTPVGRGFRLVLRTFASGSCRVTSGRDLDRHVDAMASYHVNEAGVDKARALIEAGQYVLRSEWGEVQPTAGDENAYLESHSWEEYAAWHLGLTDGANDETKARYAFVFGDFRRIHRMRLIACHYRAAEWRHKEIELAAHELLQLLDRTSS